jgi:SRSO17 transposase
LVGIQANLRTYLKHFQTEFKVGSFDQSRNAYRYLKGLLKGQTGKRNIEKICQQETTYQYQNLHHFISCSDWSSDSVMDIVQTINAELLNGQGYGYIIDEKSKAKKGSHSVGVARQYCGPTGQVDNCQTGVYSVLSTPLMSLPSNFRLFIPRPWILDKKRSRKAGLPSGLISKTKVDLAIDMIREDRQKGVIPLWYGGDCLYGRAWKLTTFIEEECQAHFVMDVPKDHAIYLTDPTLDKGAQLIRIEDYMKSISLSKREIVTYDQRKKARVHTVEVFIQHSKRDRNRSRKRILIVSKGLSKNDRVKYSLTNFTRKEKTVAQLVYMQRARFSVEQYFREANQLTGMGDYQVRTYKGWLHTQILSMMIMQLLNKIRLSLIKKKCLLSLITLARGITLILMKVRSYKDIVINLINKYRVNINTS